MDIFINLLFWIHMVSIALGGVAVFGLPVVGARIGPATPEVRPTLFAIAEAMSTMGRAAFGALIITGPLMVWLRFGGTSGFTAWFWAKMVLVVVLLGVIIYGGINAKRAQGGDMAAAKRAPIISQVGMVTFIGVILCAVFAFN